ncbi:hypothetical protein N9W79_02390 [bacterium]|nr:hypothetical protein [bacterium]
MFKIISMISLVTLLGCQTSDEAKIAGNWRVLESAKEVSCDFIKLSDRGSYYISKVMHAGNEEKGLFFANALSRSGQHVIIHAPSVNLELDDGVDPVVLAYSRTEQPVGLSETRTEFLFVDQEIDSSHILSRDLFSGEVASRLKLEDYEEASDFSAVTLKHRLLLSGYDDRLRVISIALENQQLKTVLGSTDLDSTNQIIDTKFGQSFFYRIEEAGIRVLRRDLLKGNKSLDRDVLFKTSLKEVESS